MTLIGHAIPIAKRQKRISLQKPGAAIPDGDGGWTQEPEPLDPPLAFAYVRPATLNDLERVTNGTVITQATHVVEMPFHPGVDSQTEIMLPRNGKADARLAVVSVLNPDERDKDLILLCAEVVP